jgi:FkbM family methyltransferase
MFKKLTQELFFFLRKIKYRIVNIYTNKHINVLNNFIINNKSIAFDNIEKNTELLTINKYSEKYIVSSSDKIIGRSLYIKGDFEFDIFLKTIKILENRITRNNLIDIGANIGSICIPAIKRGIFKNSIAFEPDPFNYDLLLKNVFINNLNDKIRVLNYALDQVDDRQLKFELSDDNFGDHRIKSNSKEKNLYNEDKRKNIIVNTKKLDTIMKNFNPQDALIWIDVQGYEAFILDGGATTLSKKPPLVIEFWPYGLDKFNSYHLLKQNLIKAGYKNCYDLNCNNYIENLTGNILDKIYFDYKSRKKDISHHTNLLFFD